MRNLTPSTHSPDRSIRYVVPSDPELGEQLAAEARAYFRVQLDLRCDLDTAQRVVAELVRNASQHGNGNDPARAVVCDLETLDDGGLRIQVEDDGPGFVLGAALEGNGGSTNGGLAWIRERVALLDSDPNTGRVVAVLAPLEGAAAEGAPLPDAQGAGADETLEAIEPAETIAVEELVEPAEGPGIVEAFAAEELVEPDLDTEAEAALPTEELVEPAEGAEGTDALEPTESIESTEASASDATEAISPPGDIAPASDEPNAMPDAAQDAAPLPMDVEAGVAAAGTVTVDANEARAAAVPRPADAATVSESEAAAAQGGATQRPAASAETMNPRRPEAIGETGPRPAAAAATTAAGNRRTPKTGEGAIEVAFQDDRWVVTPGHDLRAPDAEELRRALVSVLERDPRPGQIDFAAVHDIDGLCLSVLVCMHREWQERPGAPPIEITHVDEDLRKVFAATRLDHAFGVHA